MIGYLKGTIKTASSTRLLIDVNGVGYEVSIIGFPALVEDEVELFIYTYVREDRMQLYGFVDEQSLKLFRLLISVKGVGPKVGQALITGIPSSKLCGAILNEDIEVISSVPGIGKKGAERLILELRTKVGELGIVPREQYEGATTLLTSEKHREAVEALVSLGYKSSEAKKTVQQVTSEGKDLSTEEIIKKALSR